MSVDNSDALSEYSPEGNSVSTGTIRLSYAFAWFTTKSKQIGISKYRECHVINFKDSRLNNSWGISLLFYPPKGINENTSLQVLKNNTMCRLTREIILIYLDSIIRKGLKIIYKLSLLPFLLIFHILFFFLLT